MQLYIEEEGEQILVIQSPVIHTNDDPRQSEYHWKPGPFNMMEFMNSLFAAKKTEWKQSKNRCGAATL